LLSPTSYRSGGQSALCPLFVYGCFIVPIPTSPCKTSKTLFLTKRLFLVIKLFGMAVSFDTPVKREIPKARGIW